MNKPKPVHTLDLRHPTPNLQRVMHAIGWLGVLMTVPAVVWMAWQIGAGWMLDTPIAQQVDALKWSSRAAITGLLLGAIGFWDR